MEINNMPASCLAADELPEPAVAGSMCCRLKYYLRYYTKNVWLNNASKGS